MKTQFKGSLKLAAVLVAVAALGFAQTSTSAPNASGYDQAPAQRQGVPGAINYVEGQATLNGQPLEHSASGYPVAQPNQPIDTQDGYVEVLLTPGAFLRIGHNSEIVPQSLGLANVQLQVVHGWAMIEAADLVKGTLMQVNMAGATAQIEKQGLYEFDANQQLVRVLDGKAKVLRASEVKTIGKGNQIALNTPKLKSHGFEKHLAEADPLYVWSSARSEQEAEANAAVARNVEVYGGWYGPGWYWDPYWAGYAFLPGSGFLYSPFGWGFYSPGFVYAAPYYRGFYGRGFYGRGDHDHVHGFSAGVRGSTRGFHSAPSSGFHRGATRGFHGGTTGGFHGGTTGEFHGGVSGGFHGGGSHR
jgi:hypothetical protein